MTGATITDVFRWVQLDGHQAALKALAEYGTPEMLAVVRRMLADNRTAGSVRDTIELSLAWAAIPGLAEAVTPEPGDMVFDVDAFALGRGTLYMIASGDEDSPVTPLFRALASYVHYQAGLTGTRTRAGRLDPPLLMALDEVAVICPVDLPAMLADAAGKGILIMPVVHGVSQLEDRWGKAGGSTIWATCGTKLLLPGISDADTLENVSKLCGSVTTDHGRGREARADHGAGRPARAAAHPARLARPGGPHEPLPRRGPRPPGLEAARAPIPAPLRQPASPPGRPRPGRAAAGSRRPARAGTVRRIFPRPRAGGPTVLAADRGRRRR